MSFGCSFYLFVQTLESAEYCAALRPPGRDICVEFSSQFLLSFTSQKAVTLGSLLTASHVKK
ncbi:MAG: hypothetical protein KME10_05980 [Plectolyngbya sp. WJT66-NPBG17]|jgi:hypothetical protein|nr:hypothetical protein [Plectolyngbya sp. WJT66-NPBG17]